MTSREATALLAGTIADTTVACHRLEDAQEQLEAELTKLTQLLQRYLESSPERIDSTTTKLNRAIRQLNGVRAKLKIIEARLATIA